MKRFYFYAISLLTATIFAQNAKIDSLTVRLAYQNQDSTKVETSLLLIDELYKIENYNKALLFIDQTSELSKSLDYKRGLAETYFIKALINTKNDQISKAITNFEASRSYFLDMNNDIGIAKVDNNIGTLEIERGNYQKGLDRSLSAISTFESNKLNDELSTAYNSLAEAYLNTDQLNKALEYNKKALRVREGLDDLSGIKLSLKNLGLIYALKNEYRLSIDNYERMFTLLDPITDKELRSEVMVSLGRSYLAIEDADKASEYLREGLAYSRKQKDNLGILKSLNAFAELNIGNRRYKLAENQLYEANKIARSLDNDEELLYNLKLNSELDFKRQFFEDAYGFQKEYYELKEKLDAQKFAKESKLKEATENISSTDEIQNDVSDNEVAIIQDKEPENTISVNSKNDELLTYGLIAGLVFVLALLVFIWLKSSKDSREKNTYAKENKKLVIKNAQLEEVNQVKDKLFSIVSHDLKDSISSIKAFLDLLKDDGISSEEFNNLIPELSENANNASSLLFNLLNWSKSQMQNLQPKPELFNIQEIFQIKMSLIEKKVNDKGIILIDESKRDFVYADRSMLEIVIQNLITNAVKFTGKGDVITVSNQDYNGKVLICVEDTGIGISEENQKKLFNAKKNFTTIGTENEKGTGLGLTICKDLVELNKGRIWVESTPNIGSKFFIELPKDPLKED